MAVLPLLLAPLVSFTPVPVPLEVPLPHATALLPPALPSPLPPPMAFKPQWGMPQQCRGMAMAQVG